jgi:glyceraldehyde 3-phosphate dehydrogenase
MKKVAINGFGRIGRAFFRIAFGREDMQIVAINDPYITPDVAQYLLVHDSVYHRYGREVTSNEKGITIGKTPDSNGTFIPLFAKKNPKDLPWGEKGIDLVVESTGVFLSPEKATLHLDGGAKRVLLSAPPKGEGIPQIVYGVNEKEAKEHKIVSAASCTTNSLVPVAHVLEREFGIVHAFLTTVHGYTAQQRSTSSPRRPGRLWRPER